MRAYVGLGSNLGDRRRMLHRALELLDAEEGIEVAAVSTFRETDPVGYADQPRFLNAFAAVATELSPRELLERLRAVEREPGRTRARPRYGPRPSGLELVL